MIPASELDRIRTDAETLLMGTCDIHRNAPVSDGGGSFTDSWSTVSEDVPCRLAPTGLRGSEESGGRVSEVADQTLRLPAGTDIRSGDRVVIDGTEYEVTGLKNRTAFDTFLRHVEVLEVDRGG